MACQNDWAAELAQNATAQGIALPLVAAMGNYPAWTGAHPAGTVTVESAQGMLLLCPFTAVHLATQTHPLPTHPHGHAHTQHAHTDTPIPTRPRDTATLASTPIHRSIFPPNTLTHIHTRIHFRTLSRLNLFRKFSDFSCILTTCHLVFLSLIGVSGARTSLLHFDPVSFGVSESH